MLVEIALMRVVIGKEDQARPPDMCCHDAFVPFAIIDRSAMPSQKASDPLGGTPRIPNIRAYGAEALYSPLVVNGSCLNRLQ